MSDIIIMRDIVPGKEKIMTKVKVKKLDERAVLPVYGSESSLYIHSKAVLSNLFSMRIRFLQTAISFRFFHE